MKHLRQDGLRWIISIHRTMKSHLIPLLDKPLSGKGSIITPLDKLKSRMGLERTRHPSPTNISVPVL